MKKHEVKISQKYFDDVKNHIKNFEVRFNDRDYKVGDILILKEWDGREFTGRTYTTSIIYILNDKNYLNENYVVLGLSVPSTTNVIQNCDEGIFIGKVSGTLVIN